MRLTQREIDIIVKTVRADLGEAARIWLFGSRTDDEARGGDIDLYVEVPGHFAHEARRVAALTAALQLRLGERKMDILLRGEDDPCIAIHALAKSKGVELQ